MVLVVPLRSLGLKRVAARQAVWAALAVWTLLCSLIHAKSAAYSWHYFSLGARLLTSGTTVHGAGVHLYTAHPELQIGPLAFVAAEPFQAMGPTLGPLLAVLTLSLLGLGVLAALVSTVELDRRLSDSLVLVTGLLVVPVWAELATHYTHLDDGLALGFATLSLRAVRSGRPVPAGLLLAASVASKPWAIGFLPLLMALPRDRRGRALLWALAGAAAAWLPFVVGDPGTLSAGRFAIRNATDSALRALGVSDPSTPSWDRPAQLALALAVAVLLVRRRQWTSVLLAVVSARMLLDPQTYPYYTAGLVVAAAATDMLRPGRQFPLWTAGAFSFYVATGLGQFVLPPHDIGVIRAVYLSGVLAVLILSARRTPAPPVPGSHDDPAPSPSTAREEHWRKDRQSTTHDRAAEADPWLDPSSRPVPEPSSGTRQLALSSARDLTRNGPGRPTTRQLAAAVIPALLQLVRESRFVLGPAAERGQLPLTSAMAVPGPCRAGESGTAASSSVRWASAQHPA